MERIIILSLYSFAYLAIGLMAQKFVKPPQNLIPKQQKNYIGQHVSMVHAILSILLASIVYFLEGGVIYNRPTSLAQLFVIGHSCAYMIYDTIYAELFGLHDTYMRFHHIVSLAGGFLTFCLPFSGSFAIIAIIIAETSNPFMLLRHILEAKGNKGTMSYEMISYAFAIIFIFNRSILLSIVLYNLWAHPVSMVLKVFGSAIHFIGIVWVFVILSMICKRLKQQKVNWFFISFFIEIIEQIKENKGQLIVVLALHSLFLPILLTQVLNFGPINLKFGSFYILQVCQ